MFTGSIRSPRPLRVVTLATLGLVAAAIAVYAATGADIEWPNVSAPVGNLPRWLVVSLIIFFAAIVSSIVGFASSAISGGFILHFVPNGVEAVQIMMIASIGIQTYSVAGLWRSIQWRRCVPFILGGIAALPIGIALLMILSSQTYLLGMGVGLICYGLYMLPRRPTLIMSGRRPMADALADALAGALGGITGPLAAFPGACVTIWCAMRGWNKVEQRTIYHPYILVMQLIGVSAISSLQPQGTFEPTLLGYALPASAGAIFGLRVFHAVTDVQFQRMLNLALVASGSALLFK